jgi:hypothetical protein
VEAYEAERDKIQAMMTAIAASPLYAAGNDLDALYKSMADCIKVKDGYNTTTNLPRGVNTFPGPTICQQGGFLYE